MGSFHFHNNALRGSPERLRNLFEVTQSVAKLELEMLLGSWLERSSAFGTSSFPVLTCRPRRGAAVLGPLSVAAR